MKQVSFFHGFQLYVEFPFLTFEHQNFPPSNLHILTVLSYATVQSGLIANLMFPAIQGFPLLQFSSEIDSEINREKKDIWLAGSLLSHLPSPITLLPLDLLRLELRQSAKGIIIDFSGRSVVMWLWYSACGIGQISTSFFLRELIWVLWELSLSVWWHPIPFPLACDMPCPVFTLSLLSFCAWECNHTDLLLIT